MRKYLQALTDPHTQLIPPSTLPVSSLHLPPISNPGLPRALSNLPRKPYLFVLTQRQDTTDKEGPCDGARRETTADASGGFFALFEADNELVFEVAKGDVVAGG